MQTKNEDRTKYQGWNDNVHVCAHLPPKTVQLEEAVMKSQSLGWESYDLFTLTTLLIEKYNKVRKLS